MTDFMLGITELTVGMSALILLLLLTLKLFGRYFTAKCRYILWGLVILRLAVPINLGLLPSLIEIPMDAAVIQTVKYNETADIPSQTPNITAPSAADSHTAVPDLSGYPMDSVPDHAQTRPISSDTPSRAPAVNETAVPTITADQILGIAGAVCLGGTALYLVWNLTAYMIYTGRLCKHAEKADPRAQSIYRSVCKKYGIRKPPQLLSADGIHSPAAFGLFRRRIVLPDLHLTDNGLVGTLAHEVMHCKRGDLYMKFIILLARAVGWFNPLVHIAARRCETEMELSCDEAVLRGCNDDARHAYGEVMLDIIRRCRRSRGTLTTHFNPQKHAVTMRLRSILDSTEKRRGTILIAACLALCLFAGSAVACRTAAPSDDAAVNSRWYAEGCYLRYDDGSDMIIMDAYGANPSYPCRMSAADDTVSFDGLTDGDRIRIEIELIEETYPAHTWVYSVEKLSDGERGNIDEAILDSLLSLQIGAESYTVTFPEGQRCVQAASYGATLPQVDGNTVYPSGSGTGYVVYGPMKYDLRASDRFITYRITAKDGAIYSAEEVETISKTAVLEQGTPFTGTLDGYAFCTAYSAGQLIYRSVTIVGNEIRISSYVNETCSGSSLVGTYTYNAQTGDFSADLIQEYTDQDGETRVADDPKALKGKLYAFRGFLHFVCESSETGVLSPDDPLPLTFLKLDAAQPQRTIDRKYSDLLSLTAGEIRQKNGALTLTYLEHGGTPIVSVSGSDGIYLVYHDLLVLDFPNLDIPDDLIADEVIFNHQYADNPAFSGEVCGLSIDMDITQTPILWESAEFHYINGTMFLEATVGEHRLTAVVGAAYIDPRMPDELTATDEDWTAWEAEYAKSPIGNIVQIRVQ